MNEVLLEVNGLHAFEGDVDFLADKDAFVDVELSSVDIEGEPPKVEHGAQHRECRSSCDGPQEILGVLCLLEVRCNQDGPGGAQDVPRLPPDQNDETGDVLAPRGVKALRNITHGAHLRACA